MMGQLTLGEQWIAGISFTVIYLIFAVWMGLKIGRALHCDDWRFRLLRALLAFGFAAALFWGAKFVGLHDPAHSVVAADVAQFCYWPSLVAGFYLIFRPSRAEYP